MDRIQEAIQILNRLYPKEYLDQMDIERGLTDIYMAHNMAQNMSMTDKEILEYPELIDGYRQNLKIKRLLKQRT